jgi:hypothetical protein
MRSRIQEALKLMDTGSGSGSTTLDRRMSRWPCPRKNAFLIKYFPENITLQGHKNIKLKLFFCYRVLPGSRLILNQKLKYGICLTVPRLHSNSD